MLHFSTTPHHDVEKATIHCIEHPYNFPEESYSQEELTHVLSLSSQMEEFRKSLLAELRAKEEEDEEEEVQQALLPHQLGATYQDYQEDAHHGFWADNVEAQAEAQAVVDDTKPAEPSGHLATTRGKTTLTKLRVSAKPKKNTANTANPKGVTMRPTMSTPIPSTYVSEELRAAIWIARFAPRTNRQCLCEMAHIAMRTMRRYLQFSSSEHARDYNIFFGRPGRTRLGTLDRTVVRYARQLSVHPKFKQCLSEGPKLAPQMYSAMMRKCFGNK